MKISILLGLSELEVGTPVGTSLPLSVFFIPIGCVVLLASAIPYVSISREQHLLWLAWCLAHTSPSVLERLVAMNN